MAFDLEMMNKGLGLVHELDLDLKSKNQAQNHNVSPHPNPKVQKPSHKLQSPLIGSKSCSLRMEVHCPDESSDGY